jgi:hypothetical protein
MRLLVCGSRNFPDNLRSHIAEYIRDKRPTVLIHGGAAGADSIAGHEARGLGIEVIVFEAAWNIGRSAGPQRNKRMLVEGKPDLVAAFFSTPRLESRGTKSMVKLALKAEVPVEEFGPVVFSAPYPTRWE